MESLSPTVWSQQWNCSRVTKKSIIATILRQPLLMTSDTLVVDFIWMISTTGLHLIWCTPILRNSRQELSLSINSMQINKIMLKTCNSSKCFSLLTNPNQSICKMNKLALSSLLNNLRFLLLAPHSKQTTHRFHLWESRPVFLSNKADRQLIQNRWWWVLKKPPKTRASIFRMRTPQFEEGHRKKEIISTKAEPRITSDIHKTLRKMLSTTSQLSSSIETPLVFLVENSWKRAHLPIESLAATRQSATLLEELPTLAVTRPAVRRAHTLRW